MTDTVVHIGENSPEQVAYKLMQDVARVEKKLLSAADAGSGWTAADRKWLLDTYAECVNAVRAGVRSRT